MMTVVERLEALMHIRDRSQAWLGEMVGMPQSSISKVLRGEQRLYLDQAMKIADALEVSLEELTGHEPIGEAQKKEQSPDVATILRIAETLGFEETLRRLTLARQPLTIEIPKQ